MANLEQLQETNMESQSDLQPVIDESTQSMPEFGANVDCEAALNDIQPVVHVETHSGTTTHAGQTHALHVEAALEYPSLGRQQGSLHAVISVAAPSMSEDSHAPLRLVAVLDKSRSMKGSKIALMQQTMRLMLQQLSENDALGMVAYDGAATVLAPLTYCDETGRSRLEAALAKLEHGKGTNIAAGLSQGLQLHGYKARRVVSGTVLSKVRFGNTHRLLSLDEAQEHASKNERSLNPEQVAVRRHEWTMELRLEDTSDAALINKVVYTLHDSFSENVIEVRNAPFQLRKVGWGTFLVRATVHLHDGRKLELEHELCFDRPESFTVLMMQLALPQVNVKVTAGLTGKELGIIDAVGKYSVRDVQPEIAKLMGIDIVDVVLLNSKGAILDEHNPLSTLNDVTFVETPPSKQGKTLLKLEYQDSRVANTEPSECDTEQGVVRSTFLFTDGLPTTGKRNPDTICEETILKLGLLGDKRCSLSTFGFGVGHNADLLQRLADLGEGVYSFIEKEGMIGEAFGEALGGLLTTSYQNVKLCLDLEPGVSVGGVHTNFPVTRRKACLEVNMGDLFADERRNVLVTLNVPAIGDELPDQKRNKQDATPSSSPRRADMAIDDDDLSDPLIQAANTEVVQFCIGHLTARGSCVLGEPRSEEASPVELQIVREEGVPLDVGAGHAQVARHKNRLVATEALTGARAACNDKRLREARRILRGAVDRLQSSTLTQEGDALSLALLADLFECLEDLKDEELRFRKTRRLALEEEDPSHAVPSKADKSISSITEKYTKERSGDFYSNDRMCTLKKAFGSISYHKG